jgi:anaerobic sulfite reductase subunit B
MPSAVLSSRRDVGGGLLLVELAVEDALADAYVAPGQYIKVTLPGASGYFVLASQVGTSPWELLVKNAGDAADALIRLPLGSAITLDGPLGKGFPGSLAPSRGVVVAVVGSALGVARAVVEARIAAGAARATSVLVGVRAPTDLPIEAELAAWCAHGVDVVLCLSRGEIAHHVEVLPRARRAAGYVQRVLARAVEAGEIPVGVLVVVAGPSAMLSDMRALADSTPAARLEISTNV